MTASPTKISRISALDFTKGALVLIMVLYHWMNYFMGPNLDYRYLRFLTPSFIFLTGFLISHVYLSKYNVDPLLSKKLLRRGMKLMGVFLVLNVGRTLLLLRLSGSSILADQLNPNHLSTIFVLGDSPVVATGKLISFYILIPISYVLLLSAALLLPYRVYRYTFHAVCILLLLCILVLGLNGARSPNLEFVAIGLLGVWIGFTPIQSINNIVRHPLLLSCAYLLYLAVIAVWNVPFASLVVGVGLSVWAIYLIGLRDGEPSRARRHIILLGQHSLFGYVAQIAILQVLKACFNHVNLGFGTIAISFAAAFFLTMATVEVLEYLRRRSIIVDRLYRTAFA